MTLATTILGWCAAGISILFLIPQLLRLIKNKSARDLSLITTILILTTEISWSVYGLIMGQVQVHVTNITCSCFAVSILIYQLVWIAHHKVEYKVLSK